jgi:hypothetical protein
MKTGREGGREMGVVGWRWMGAFGVARENVSVLYCTVQHKKYFSYIIVVYGYGGWK